MPGPTSDEHDLRLLGRAVHGLREQRHLDRAALAAAAGIPETDLAAIEAGRLDPGYRRLRRLAAALGPPRPRCCCASRSSTRRTPPDA